MEFEQLKSYQQVLLNQVYAQKIQKNEEDIKTWTQYRDRHKKIIEGLETLSQELSLNCMVPLGKRALMKGKLTHTNEILVCIGDGYFAKYSSPQAIALCNRRIKRSDEMLKKLEQEKNLLEVRQMLPVDYGAFETGDIKDVIELWDEEKIQNWKVEHRKKEKEYREKLKQLKSQKKKEISTEDDLFKRLDELELEEELTDELNRLEHLYDQDLQTYDDPDEPTKENEKDETEQDEDEEFEQEETETEDERIDNEEEENKEIHSIKKQKIAETCKNETIIDTIDKQLNYSSELQMNQQNDVLGTTNKEKKDETIIRSVDKIQASSVKETKINGKFEVSIISEDEVEKMLGRSSISPDSSRTNKSMPLEVEKNKSNLENFNSEISENNTENLKYTNRRVSFAEPHYIEMEYNCDEDNRSEQGDQKSREDSKSEYINDDTIRINFKHSKTKLSILEGTKNDIISPEDIYRIFCKPKSILKRSLNDCHPNKSIPLIHESFHEDNSEDCNSVRSAYNIVVQDIKERKLEKPIAKCNKPPNKKSISRFKLERSSIKK